MAKEPTTTKTQRAKAPAAQDAGLAPAAAPATDPAPPAEAPQAPEPAAEPEAPAPAEPTTQEQPAAAEIPELDDYIAQHEKAAQDAGLVVTALSHPAAKPRMHLGVYSGFPIDAGELSAIYSDGSTH